MTATTVTAPKKKICFVVCPIGSDGSAERTRSDKVLKYIFEKALDPLGYKADRADKIAEPGMITVQVLQRVIEAELVIADLTGWNANVFYELAVRHAYRKPFIQVIQSGEKIPFDIADLRTIPISTEVDDAERAIKEIQDQVKQIEAGNVGETPIKLAAVMMQLNKDPRDEVLREILNTSLAIRTDLQALSKKMEPGYTISTLTASGGPGFGALRPISDLRHAGSQGVVLPRIGVASIGKVDTGLLNHIPGCTCDGCKAARGESG